MFLMYFKSCLNLFHLEIKIRLLLKLILLIVHLANLVKANRFLFHCIQPTPSNLLNSYILMYGAPVISHEHYKYFVTFIDDFTRFT